MLKNKQIKTIILTIIVALSFISCGSSSDAPIDDRPEESGQFIDAPVEGLDYECSSGLSGITDVNGSFTCKAGDTVVFKIGDIVVGSCSVQAIVTPLHLYPDEEDREIAYNIAQLLHSLADGGDVSEGIKLLKDLNLDGIDVQSDDFENQLASALASIGRTAYNRDKAKAMMFTYLKTNDVNVTGVFINLSDELEALELQMCSVTEKLEQGICVTKSCEEGKKLDDNGQCIDKTCQDDDYNCPQCTIDENIVYDTNGDGSCIIKTCEDDGYNCLIATGDAIATDVLEGKTFSNSYDVSIFGTMINYGGITIEPSTYNQTIPEGYHNGLGMVIGNSNLISDNIRYGSTIFGVTGSYTGVGGTIQNTSSGDAVAGDILLNKKAWVDGVEVTGTVPTGVNIDGPAGSLSFTITDGLYSGNKTSTASDANLVTGNIKANTSIFGVSGDSNVVDTSSGDAATEHVQFGKKAWVDGVEVTGHLAGGTPCNPAATYSPLKRWVHNGNGTITDTTTGLIWYHRGNYFFGRYDTYNRDYDINEPESTINPKSLTEGFRARISNMHHMDPPDLTDGSTQYQWRIPTLHEMQELTSGVEAISSNNQYLFIGISFHSEYDIYWTSSTHTEPMPMREKVVKMNGNSVLDADLNDLHYSMAVRNP